MCNTWAYGFTAGNETLQAPCTHDGHDCTYTQMHQVYAFGGLPPSCWALRCMYSSSLRSKRLRGLLVGVATLICRLPLAGSALPLEAPLRTGVAGRGLGAPLAGAAGFDGACTVAVETGWARGLAGAGSLMVAMSCAAGVGGAGACACGGHRDGDYGGASPTSHKGMHHRPHNRAAAPLFALLTRTTGGREASTNSSTAALPAGARPRMLSGRSWLAWCFMLAVMVALMACVNKGVWMCRGV